RRAIQTVLNELLQVFVRLLVPVTPHLAEDIWQFMPPQLRGKEESVLLTDFPAVNQRYVKPELTAFWTDLLPVRATANKALEQARAAGHIGKSLGAQVQLTVDEPPLRHKLESLGKDLAVFFITSQASIIGESNTMPKGEGKVILAQSPNENGVVTYVLRSEEHT